MGLISTVIITNTSFVDRYQSDQAEPYKVFLNFLSEESALTKKTLAWFIGENTQTIYTNATSTTDGIRRILILRTTQI